MWIPKEMDVNKNNTKNLSTTVNHKKEGRGGGEQKFASLVVSVCKVKHAWVRPWALKRAWLCYWTGSFSCHRAFCSIINCPWTIYGVAQLSGHRKDFIQ